MNPLATLRIPLLPVTRNARDRMNRWDRGRERDDFYMLTPMCPAKDRQGVNDPPRLVEIIFYKRRGPLSDDDNRYARCKAPLDALVARGWLYDDRPAYCRLIAREEISGATSETVISIVDDEYAVTEAA